MVSSATPSRPMLFSVILLDLAACISAASLSLPGIRRGNQILDRSEHSHSSKSRGHHHGTHTILPVYSPSSTSVVDTFGDTRHRKVHKHQHRNGHKTHETGSSTPMTSETGSPMLSSPVRNTEGSIETNTPVIVSPVKNPGFSVNSDCLRWVWVNSRSTNEDRVTPPSTHVIYPKIAAAVSGGGYYEVPYPAAPVVGSSAIGAKMITEYLQSEHAKCPDTKFVLFGYSQGATLVHYVLNHPEIISSDAIIAVLLQGDEFFIEGQPWSRGTAKKGRDRPGGPKGLFLPNGIPAAFVSKTIDICDEGDRVCSDDSTASSAVHQGYKNRPEDTKIMVDFAIERLKTL